MNEIQKHSVVLYNGLWHRVTACFKNTVNLGGIFSKKTRLKGIPKSEVKEDYDNWSKAWSKSESYQSM
jgi:hypothetical protein